MTASYKMVVEYDGTAYNGWQIQNEVPTIQGEIESVLQQMTGRHVRITASGRTDAGVHALGQVVGFSSDIRLSVAQLHQGMNSLLPADIVIHSLSRVAPGFHPRYEAVSKVYRYRILNRKRADAIGRQYVWHLKPRLNLDAMQTAANQLIGIHDFTAFEGSGSPRTSTKRHVMGVSVSRQTGNLVVFEIEANGFLRFMVRNIVGTLVEVGLGKRSTEDFKKVLDSRERSQAGPTAPPQGLFLIEVKYGE